MNKLHCDKCDKVIEDYYYEITRRSTNVIVDSLIFPINRYKQICCDCFNKIMEAENE